ncbi:MAG TPA: hypothetical protein VHP83_10760 [Aggregatilineaceae bacterium]|nr:hypothetical protein [Aggregatilineaceae bacterium]
MSYEFQLAKVNTFVNPVQDVTLAGTSFTPAANLANGNYYWRVRAINGSGTAGLWSVARLVVIDNLAPRLVSPLSLSGTTATTVTLRWTASATAASYEVQVDDDPAFGSATPYTPTTATQVLSGLSVGTTYYWQVRFVDAEGNPSTWSAPWNFSVVASVVTPARPVLSTPTTGSATNDTTPEFTWQAAANGTSYEFQVDNLNTFASPEMSYTGPALNFTLSSPLPAGRYYWRVRAVSADHIAGPWSVIWNVVIDLTPPAAPVLSTPVNNSSTPTTTPRLVWVAAASANGYRLQVDTVDTFDSGSTLVIEQAPVAYPFTSPLTDGTTYYWRVQAKDPAGNWSGWSAVYHFRVTMLRAPLDGSATTDTTPTFAWYAVTGTGVTYQFQLDDAPVIDEGSLVDSSSGAALARTTPVLPYGKYYWRVRPVISGVPGAWSQTWLVTVTPTPPVRPVQTAPVTATLTNDNTPTFTWRGVTNGVYYQLQIASNTTFNYPVQDVTGDDGVVSYTALQLADGKYFWRVRAFNSLDVPGAWSAVWNLTVDATAPALPTLVAPANGASVTNPKLKLQWAKVSDAVNYYLLLDRAPSYVQPAIRVGNVLTYIPPTKLSQGEYQWCVMAVDQAGNVSACSETWNFTLVAGYTIAGDSPVVLDPPSRSLIEAESAAQTGTWTAYASEAASGGQYIYSSGTAGDALSLSFEGTGVDVVYVQHPALGTFAIEVDGVVQQTLVSTAESTIFGAQATVSGLSAGAHTLRVVAVEGTIAIDAFHVIAAEVVPTPVPTDEATAEPTVEPTSEPTTTPVLPVLVPPVSDAFDGTLAWTASGSWQADTQSAYSGSGWFVEALTRDQSSTLTAGYQLDLRVAVAPQLTFWQQLTLTSGEVAAVDVSLDGVNWLPLDVQIGTSSAWAQRTVDLSAYRGSVIQLRFRLDTFGAVPAGQTAFGWWIDELSVAEAAVVIPPTATPDAWILPTDVPATEVVPTEQPTEEPPSDGWVLPS